MINLQAKVIDPGTDSVFEIIGLHARRFFDDYNRNCIVPTVDSMFGIIVLHAKRFSDDVVS